VENSLSALRCIGSALRVAVISNASESGYMSVARGGSWQRPPSLGATCRTLTDDEVNVAFQKTQDELAKNAAYAIRK
jgi:hypothetical protein